MLRVGVWVAMWAGVCCWGQSPLPDSPKPATESQTEAQKTEAARQALPRGFFGRWGEFYREDWKGTTPQSPAPPRRGLPSPLDSPPFPNADWSYGGSPVIGEADTNSYPLMSAINGARSRTKIYGWISPSFNLSTSSESNSPEANDAYPNTVQLQQAVIYVERLPDSVQHEHVDVGYHFTALYGTDYRYTTNVGYFSNQFLVHGYRYGFDPSLEYMDIYVPKVAKGMDIRIGRFISIPGIEAQLTPNNYIFSHSLLYSVDPFTDTGVLATIQLNDQWVVQTGVTASHDVAPWTSYAHPAADFCVSYTTKSVRDNLYLCANGINDGIYSFNNIQQYDGTWYHKIGKSWHLASEAYVMYQRDVPTMGSGAIIRGTNGAVCQRGQTTCFAPEWAMQNYINKELSPHDFISFRSDFLNDKKGQRTGVNTKYTENTFMWSHWVGSTVQIRPEMRFDHSWDRAGYDKGTKSSQFTFSSDLVFHF
jgi:hypothetical protein